MKQIFLLVLSILTIKCYSQKIDTLSLNSQLLNEQRKLIVYTPAKYTYAENQKFEVIYVFDAQAREIFDMVQSTMVFKNNDICPMIVVGIVSTDRNKDFLPTNEYKETADKFNGHLGNADKFLHFVSDELVSFIDKKYRTLPKRIAIGHSNGGTFISYCFLQNPELFDAYIAISPNFGYDKMQFVKRFKSLKPSSLISYKFFYMCNATGFPEEGDWISARTQIAGIFNSKAFNKKIIFKNQDFAASESHWSVFQIGVLNGIKEYFNYQYFTSDNLLKYYDFLYNKKLINLNPQNTNQLAYNFFYMNKPKDAVKILLWAHQLFPKDLNLFDSIGEMYQNLNKKDEANKYYLLLDKNIEEQKSTLKAKEYEQLKKGVKDRIISLNNKK